jgi:hypothetical protein
MRGVFGGLLMGCGILIAGLSGLCTLVMVGSMFVDGGGMTGEVVSIGIAILIFGGAPFIVGLGAFFVGRYLIRSQRREEPAVYSNRPFEPLKPEGMAHPDPTRERGDLS